MPFQNEETRLKMVEMVKAGGQEIIDRAEDIIGDGESISSIELRLYFDDACVPELEVRRAHLCYNASNVLINEKLQKAHSKYPGLNTDIKLIDEIKPTFEKIKGWSKKARAEIEKQLDRDRFVRENPEYHIGDRLDIGEYTATCVKVEVNEEFNCADYTFCFDTYIDEKMRHEEMLIKLDTWFRSYEGFNYIRDDVVAFPNPGYSCHLRVPYVGEMFGSEEKRKYYIPDNPDGTWKEQWECMKDVRNRITIHKGDWEWGVLMNESANTSTSPFFGVVAYVNCLGSLSSINRAYPIAIRPVFVLRKDHIPESE